MSKYWVVFKVALSERLVYRADFFIATFLRFVPIVTTILLWRAIYDGAGREQIVGLTYTAMVSYYLFTMITRAFSSMPGLASGIAKDVREGDLRKFLLQPIDYVLYKLVLRMAHKLVYYVMAVAPYAVVFWLCRDYLTGWPDPLTLGAYGLSLALGFLLGFAVGCFVGMLSFWFLEISSFIYVFMLGQYFLSGHMFPLSLLPESIRGLLTWLPFAYEVYYPNLIILQQLSGGEITRVLLVQAGWIVIIAAAGRALWLLGLRRYAAFGG